MSLVGVMSCHVEVSATSLSLIQRSPIGCHASAYDLETLSMKSPRPANIFA